jgi:hypothetical protein
LHSITFETIRSNQPSIPKFIVRRHPRHPRGVNKQEQATSVKLEIPIHYLASAIQSDAGDKKEDNSKVDVKDKMERGELHAHFADGQAETSSTAAVPLQDLFMARLEAVQSMQEEHDDLTNYENYIRSQYAALANDTMSPRAVSSHGTVIPTFSSSPPAGAVEDNNRRRASLRASSIQKNKKRR